MIRQDTIAALATPPGMGAIAIIRVSGSDAITIADQIFHSVRGKKLHREKSHTIHLGTIVDGVKSIDQVLVSLFKAPHSYTGENVVEISCHGSLYIQNSILQLLLRNGCRIAEPGEFTLRAFLNAKMDLSQAEAVADLIASENEASHQVAMQQMRGGFSDELAKLRDDLLNFASLIELELDFAEEDVEFADRTKFHELLAHIESVLKKLLDSFAVGNVIKNGIPIAIAGEPNVGKSTLLNALLNEERAIVSDIAGTTRDTVEDEISIGGIGFRFIDTAGIRETTDVVEQIGIQRTFEKIGQARLVLYLVDLAPAQNDFLAAAQAIRGGVEDLRRQFPNIEVTVIGNKSDVLSEETALRISEEIPEMLLISARKKHGLDELKAALLSLVNAGLLQGNDTIVTNTRHYDALRLALEEIIKVRHGLAEHLSTDLLAIDIRQALYHFGEITGQVSNDELLGNIFGKFCIGK